MKQAEGPGVYSGLPVLKGFGKINSGQFHVHQKVYRVK